jgi:TatD DNase family protein
MIPELIDTHCHLTLGELAPVSDEAWARARAAGVTAAVVIGIDAATSEAAVSWVEGRAGLYASVGIHPNGTAQAKDRDLDAIRELAAHPRVVALGETGLDTYWKDSPLDVQRKSLHEHAELALDLDLPIVLHLRDAFPQAIEALTPLAARGLRAVVHCFSGTERDIHPFIDWGWPLSFSGIISYAKADDVRRAAAATPLDLCLVETDSPWLTPAPYRGKKMNEPAFVVQVAEALAAAKGLPFEDVAAATTANARRFFRLP